MRLDINPHIGAGPLRFGMTIDEVRRAIPVRYSSFKPTPTSEMPYDSFDSEGIFVYYKPSGHCEAIEIADPSCPIFREHELLGKPYRGIREMIRRLDPQLTEDGAGLTSLALGIGLYSPSAGKNEDSPIESAIVFEKGYYD